MECEKKVHVPIATSAVVLRALHCHEGVHTQGDVWVLLLGMEGILLVPILQHASISWPFWPPSFGANAARALLARVQGGGCDGQL